MSQHVYIRVCNNTALNYDYPMWDDAQEMRVKQIDRYISHGICPPDIQIGDVTEFEEE